MKQYKTLVVIEMVILFCTINLSAQAPDTLWTKVFGNALVTDRSYCIQETSDSCYIVIGHTRPRISELFQKSITIA